MLRAAATLLLSLLAALSLPATTLEKLSMDQLIERSTAIVRGTVAGSGAMQRGSVIYTTYRIRVAQTLRGTAPSVIEVSVPGGQLNGVRQSFSGSPVLEPNTEYVIFIWTSKSGINHTIGLAQGVFDVKPGTNGSLVLTRGAIDAHIVDASGKEAEDRGLSITLIRLAERIRALEAQSK
jgi:hypothetical protein